MSDVEWRIAIGQEGFVRRSNDLHNYQLKLKVVFFVLVLCFVSTVSAQAVLAPEQLIERYELRDLKWSANGDQIAAVATEPVSNGGQPKHIWMYDAKEYLFRQLTANGDNNYRPRWSSNGKMLAFRSSRNEEERQVYILPCNPGCKSELDSPGLCDY